MNVWHHRCYPVESGFVPGPSGADDGVADPQAGQLGQVAEDADPSAVSGRDRNLIWRTFTGRSTRVRKTDAEVDDFETNAVADLRRAVGTYPNDARLRQLVDELRQASPRFARLWAERMVNSTGPNSKTIDHPEVGPITLDCDVLTVAGSDLRLVVYTAEPSSPDANRLRLVQVIGLQKLTARDRPA